MIIVRVFQGLGNQLFQYAMGRAVSHRLGTELALDLSYFLEYSHHRRYGLDRFRIAAREATAEEIERVKRPQFGRISAQADYFLRKYTGYPLRGIINEDLKAPPIRPDCIRDNCYLHGYFTSEDFFLPVAHLIREELRLKEDFGAENRPWAGRMADTLSVALSIRRGDFVNNPLHDVCDIGFFHRATEEMASRIGRGMELFIWSDEPEWAQQHFKPAFKHHFMVHNQGDYHRDLELMTYCKHHIIPNSTFSWWGAWLGEKPGQVVVAPQRWLNTTEFSYEHYLPSRWVRIEN